MRTITDHARQRIKKRIGSRDAESNFGEALLYGVKQNQAKGDLKRYLSAGAIKHQSDCVIYKGFVFWHKKTKLITVIPLPQKFLKYVKPKSDE